MNTNALYLSFQTSSCPLDTQKDNSDIKKYIYISRHGYCKGVPACVTFVGVGMYCVMLYGRADRSDRDLIFTHGNDALTQPSVSHSRPGCPSKTLVELKSSKRGWGEHGL